MSEETTSVKAQWQEEVGVQKKGLGWGREFGN